MRAARKVSPAITVLGVLAEVAKLVYAAFFSWWFDPIQRHKADREFREHIAKDLDGVFGEHGVIWMPNDLEDFKADRAFDLAIATATSLDFDLRFRKVRGQFDVFVRPRDGSSGWTDAAAVLARDEMGQSSSLQLYAVGSAWDGAKMLEQNWDRLSMAMNGERNL